MSDRFDQFLEGRLRRALDRLTLPTPSASGARYQAMAAPRQGRLRPAIAALAVLALVILTGTAATGSPNPAVWTQQAGETLQAVTHPAKASPPPAHHSSLSPRPQPSETRATGGGTSHQSPQPKVTDPPEGNDRPEPGDSPEPTGPPHDGETPSPDDTHSRSGSPSPGGSPGGG
jgi:hypothetical protein